MEYFPLFMRVHHRRVLVVGGGAIARRKAELLARAGARLRVVALDIAPDVARLAERSGGEARVAAFSDSDLDAVILVVAATDDAGVNRRVSDAAQQRQVPVNVVDQPELCTVIVPSLVDRSPLLIALSSGGAAPVLLRVLRKRLEATIPVAYGRLARLAARYRDRVKRNITDPDARRRFWEDILEGDVAEQVLSGREQRGERSLQAALANHGGGARRGEVYLVGAGPGDPELLTLKALRLMQQADVVLHDNLISDGILDLLRRDAERVYVGKRRAFHAVRQTSINQLLVEHARAGRRVLRLKGGDPFVFGRGGEEIDSLAEQGIAFQVVPGVTAANGSACYAGIPLTHRDYAQSVRFVTGHLRDGSVNLAWPELADPQQTLVVYMGLAGLEVLCDNLIEHGRDPATAIALIERATLPEQRVVLGTLRNIAERVRGAEVRGPTLLIVGEVVRLRERLAWREDASIP